MSVDGPTNAIYEANAKRWESARTTTDPGPPERLLHRGVVAGLAILDLGCGPGFHLAALPDGSIGLDPAGPMLTLARDRVAEATLVQGGAATLPLRSGSLGGAIVSKVLIHIDRPQLPMAVAELHRVLAVDAPVEVVMFGGDQDLTPLRGGDLPGRRFALWERQPLTDVFTGAGFALEHWAERESTHWPRLDIGLRRLRSLPDTVGPGMRLLVCGLNPSLHSADMGIGFARAGNRFWPAALAAGLVGVDRDPRRALADHRVGMTDLVKRATPRADQLSRDEYRAGLGRLERLCERLGPAAVCMVGLAGWRAAADHNATAGWQHRRLGDSPVYVMPSTSGLNAHAQLPDLTEHLRAALEPPAAG